MRTILITGGIGSGKSAVCRILESRGIPVYDADSHAKSIYDKHPEVVGKLEKEFGRCLSLNGILDKRRLAGIVFSDEEKLKYVESMVHPLVLQDFEAWKKIQCPETLPGMAEPFVVLESAIALDKPLFREAYDYVVLVDAPEDVRVARAVSRDNASPESVRARIAAQTIRHDMADAVIVNDKGMDELAVTTFESISKLPFIQ